MPKVRNLTTDVWLDNRWGMKDKEREESKMTQGTQACVTSRSEIPLEKKLEALVPLGMGYLKLIISASVHLGWGYSK